MSVSMPAIVEANILIVDDHEAEILLLEQLLRDDGYYHVSSTTNSREVRALHERNHYDLILLDLNMPGHDGFQVMAELKKDEAGSYLPVLALTVQPSHKLPALQAGARDFISKPFDLFEVRSRIHNMLEVRLLYRQLENSTNKFKYKALHDPMTGLPNRELFDDRTTHAVALAKRHAWTLAVMFLDLNGFKCINDTHGHAVGDEVLREVGRRLSGSTRDEDTMCRSGGDEFLCLLINPGGTENIERIAETLATVIGQPIDVGELRLHVGVTIGIAVCPANGATAERLIEDADTAMYRAKKGMVGHMFFDSSETTGSVGGRGARSPTPRSPSRR